MKSNKNITANAGELYTLARELKSIALQLQHKYYVQEIQYKTMGASKAALKENARRRALCQELLIIAGKYERQTLKAMQTQFSKSRHVQFTIYPNGRR